MKDLLKVFLYLLTGFLVSLAGTKIVGEPQSIQKTIGYTFLGPLASLMVFADYLDKYGRDCFINCEAK